MELIEIVRSLAVDFCRYVSIDVIGRVIERASMYVKNGHFMIFEDSNVTKISECVQSHAIFVIPTGS